MFTTYDGAKCTVVKPSWAGPNDQTRMVTLLTAEGRAREDFYAHAADPLIGH